MVEYCCFCYVWKNKKKSLVNHLSRRRICYLVIEVMAYIHLEGQTEGGWEVKQSIFLKRLRESSPWVHWAARFQCCELKNYFSTISKLLDGECLFLKSLLRQSHSVDSHRCRCWYAVAAHETNRATHPKSWLMIRLSQSTMSCRIYQPHWHFQDVVALLAPSLPTADYY